MKRLFFVLFAFIIVIFCFLGCEDDTTSLGTSSEKFVSFPNIVFPEIMYYGANIGYFPPKARDWIINIAFARDKMEKPYMTNSSLNAWWSEDNNKILFEASYILLEGYVGAGTLQTWGQGAYYSGSSKIFDTYGKYAVYQTLRFNYEYRLDVEMQLRNDLMYAEVIEFAKQLCAEIEYDWANFSGYKGPVKPTPGLRYSVCDGYANEVMDKILQLNSVKSVEKWASPGHAWNVLKLVDGRTLYFDLTWFDNESINTETGEIYQTDDYGWENITFYEHLFRFSNIGLGSKVFHHNIGKFVKENS
ncbi:hypothetical protein R84B8_02543 [Treponema sp. R8-4-B8]